MVDRNSDDWAKAVTAEMAEGALDAIQQLLDEGGVPRGTFTDDQVRNLVVMFNRRGDEIEALRAALVGGPVKRFISPFPAPSAYQTELLACMIEEVAEVVEETVIMTGSSMIKRATKTMRFGADEVQPGQPHSNKERLSTEVGDLLAILDFASAAGLIDPELVNRQRAAKPAKLRKFLQNQMEAVTPSVEEVLPTQEARDAYAKASAGEYWLFVDDERFPPDDGMLWIIVRSFDEAVVFMQKNGCPSYVSFDHDLGEGKSGHDLVKWMIDEDLMGNSAFRIPEGFSFYVHSQNPIGAENIRCDMINYLNYKKTAR